MNKRSLLTAAISLLAAVVVSAAPVRKSESEPFRNAIRPPATPLITVDPYFSLWSASDELTGDVTRHWTGWKQPLLGAVRVDGTVYRIIGSETPDTSVREGNKNGKVQPGDSFYAQPETVAFPKAGRQTSSNVLPTSTVYTFRCGGVEVELTFTAPLLLDDLDLLSRPVNYVTYKIKSLDGRKHQAELYLEASPRFAIDLDVVPVKAVKGSADGVDFVSTGTVAQRVLDIDKRGDDVRIDWGYFYLGTAAGDGDVALVNTSDSRKSFISSGKVSAVGDQVVSDNFVKDALALAYTKDLGKVGKTPVTDVVMLAYDDISSIYYLRRDTLRAYWNRSGQNVITREMGRAITDYQEIVTKCSMFDAQLIADATASGGKEYADLCALAYRQAISAHKLVESKKGELFFFSKENFSNGCCGTVDVTYPSMPLMLLYNNDIAKALLNFIFDYCESDRWNKNWAAHDVGVYPDAYGQHYGNHMPLEECGNMLIMTAAVVKNDGDLSYASRHWTSLTKWALYMVEHGQNPENQLCTDDFAGRLAHNVNLSAKSIIGIAAYAQLAEKLGKTDEAAAFRSYARMMATNWKRDAFEEDHYRLAYDAEGTWSQKYNLVWDRLLGTDIFDEDIRQTEMDYYASKQNVYGLPLDCRKAYTKTDWILWTATMARSDEEFRSYMLPVVKFYNETVDRVPLADWVDTDAPTQQKMDARSVVGGFFMKILSDRWLK